MFMGLTMSSTCTLALFLVPTSPREASIVGAFSASYSLMSSLAGPWRTSRQNVSMGGLGLLVVDKGV